MIEKHFTTTVYIINEKRVLLHFHAKLQKWLPPGGHLELNETPTESARREVMEETGLEIEFVPQENIWIDRWNARSLERPYLCLLENIPAHKNVSAHQHIDLIYVARPTSPIENAHESCHWFSVDELSHFRPDEEIFEDTLHIIKHLLSN